MFSLLRINLSTFHFSHFEDAIQVYMLHRDDRQIFLWHINFLLYLLSVLGMGERLICNTASVIEY